MCPNLSKIDFSDSSVTDVGVEALAKACPRLGEFQLQGTKITDEGALALVTLCPDLFGFGLGRTEVTESAKQLMTQERPILQFVSDNVKF